MGRCDGVGCVVWAVWRGKVCWCGLCGDIVSVFWYCHAYPFWEEGTDTCELHVSNIPFMENHNFACSESCGLNVK